MSRDEVIARYVRQCAPTITGRLTEKPSGCNPMRLASLSQAKITIHTRVIILHSIGPSLSDTIISTEAILFSVPQRTRYEMPK